MSRDPPQPKPPPNPTSISALRMKSDEYLIRSSIRQDILSMRDRVNALQQSNLKISRNIPPQLCDSLESLQSQQKILQDALRSEQIVARQQRLLSLSSSANALSQKISEFSSMTIQDDPLSKTLSDISSSVRTSQAEILQNLHIEVEAALATMGQNNHTDSAPLRLQLRLSQPTFQRHSVGTIPPLLPAFYETSLAKTRQRIESLQTLMKSVSERRAIQSNISPPEELSRMRMKEEAIHASVLALAHEVDGIECEGGGEIQPEQPPKLKDKSKISRSEFAYSAASMFDELRVFTEDFEHSKEMLRNSFSSVEERLAKAEANVAEIAKKKAIYEEGLCQARQKVEDALCEREDQISKVAEQERRMVDVEKPFKEFRDEFIRAKDSIRADISFLRGEVGKLEELYKKG